MADQARPKTRKSLSGPQYRDVIVDGVEVGRVKRISHNKRGMLPRGQRNGWVPLWGEAELREVQVTWPPYPPALVEPGHGDVYDTLGQAADVVRRYAQGDRYEDKHG